MLFTVVYRHIIKCGFFIMFKTITVIVDNLHTRVVAANSLKQLVCYYDAKLLNYDDIFYGELDIDTNEIKISNGYDHDVVIPIEWDGKYWE